MAQQPEHVKKQQPRTKVAVQVDVIIPVHNAAATLEETIRSAMHQVIPRDLLFELHQQQRKEVCDVQDYQLSIAVCCYDDGSTDSSWEILQQLLQEFQQEPHINNNDDDIKASDSNTTPQQPQDKIIPSRLLISKSSIGVGRGAGYARNRAVEINNKIGNNIIGSIRGERFLCLLDSDDTMHPTRVAEQAFAMLQLSSADERERMLLGCLVKRDPPNSTWHYTQWANGLTEERLYLERFREVTLLQPTWMMCRSRFELLGGYLEAPDPSNHNDSNCSSIFPDNNHHDNDNSSNGSNCVLRVIHPTFDTPQTLRLAEDLRFFHAHLAANGLLRLHRPIKDPNLALVTYRHRVNHSQSFQTSRKLLLHLRAVAFESCILRGGANDSSSVKNSTSNDESAAAAWTTLSNYRGAFVVWGAGRDGKEFVRAISEESRKRIFCFVDVDAKKIQQGYYENRELGLKIPIVHFSLLAKDPATRQKLLEEDTNFGAITKSKETNRTASSSSPPCKRQKLRDPKNRMAWAPHVKNLDLSVLPDLPVVVCVAMYRTNGALEKNVASIGRVEGKTVWHFC